MMNFETDLIKIGANTRERNSITIEYSDATLEDARIVSLPWNTNTIEYVNELAKNESYEIKPFRIIMINLDFCFMFTCEEDALYFRINYNGQMG